MANSPLVLIGDDAGQMEAIVGSLHQHSIRFGFFISRGALTLQLNQVQGTKPQARLLRLLIITWLKIEDNREVEKTYPNLNVTCSGARAQEGKLVSLARDNDRYRKLITKKAESIRC
ncbi:hypothetical protein L2E82_00217 [Cichorium intybus]|uniref:Uncharacterized protein n=1 Tax=Cichorium intybus TaxID=13427 RepID=A0ACB9GWP1_CICIN|nr:hypothetical protein L2E82_00217 [Cichorium intybus]